MAKTKEKLDISAEELHSMSLHEVLYGGFGVRVIRVPGGWLYRDSRQDNVTSTFVPYHDEYRPKTGSDWVDPDILTT